MCVLLVSTEDRFTEYLCLRVCMFVCEFFTLWVSLKTFVRMPLCVHVKYMNFTLWITPTDLKNQKLPFTMFVVTKHNTINLIAKVTSTNDMRDPYHSKVLYINISYTTHRDFYTHSLNTPAKTPKHFSNHFQGL